MSIIQTEWPNFHDEYVDGQVANTQTCDVDSFRLVGTDNVPFGRIIQPVDSPAAGSADSVARGNRRSVSLGASREQIALLDAALNNSATSLSYDSSVAGERFQVGQFIVVNDEIMSVSAIGANLTVVRGALGSSAAAHANNDPIFAFDSIVMAGIAVSDPRLPATSGGVYTPNEVVSGLWRGDVASRVSSAVSRGDDVVVATAASGAGNTLETVGQLSSRAPDSTHILIPNAEFMSDTAAQGIAVVRLSGPQR